MPMINGYSIYVGTARPEGQGWIVRAYRDSDDTHIHSAEGCPLTLGLREAEAAIVRDITNKRDAVSAEVLSDDSKRGSE